MAETWVSLEEQLLEAVDQRNHELVKKLLDQGARVNEARDVNGMTCLMLASSNHCLALQCNPNIRGEMLVLTAEDKRKPDIVMVKLLLVAGADVTAKSKGKSCCLHYAVGVDQSGELTKILLEAGAKSLINHRNFGGLSPLESAIVRNRELPNRKLIVQILIDAGAKLSTRVFTRLSYYSNYDDEILLIFLATLGADDAVINCPGHFNAWQFHDAIRRYSSLDVVKQMIRLGTNVNSIVSKDGPGSSPLQLAVQADDVDMVKSLLELGANPNSPLECGMNILYLALRQKTKNQHRIVNLLLASGADMYANLSRISIFESLVLLGQVDAVRLLLEHGLNLKKYSPKFCDDFSPLHEAIKVKNNDMLSLLLEYKTKGSLNLEHEDRFRRTPLILSFEKGSPGCTKLLLESGVDVKHVNIELLSKRYGRVSAQTE